MSRTEVVEAMRLKKIARSDGALPNAGGDIFPGEWTCACHAGRLAWLDDWLAMNSRGKCMRKPEYGRMLS